MQYAGWGDTLHCAILYGNNSTELPRALRFLGGPKAYLKEDDKSQYYQMFFFTVHVQHVPKLKALIILSRMYKSLLEQDKQ